MTLYEQLQKNHKLLIDRHLDLVIEANKTTNLTRIDTREDAYLLHIEDSLTGLEELKEAPGGWYGDLGTGAGYPGIPLAIVSGRQTTLIDARKRKIQVLNGFIKELGLEEQIFTYAGRAELLARKQSEQYAVLTARALAKLPVLMELASPLLKQDGRLICYKAQIEESELAHARRVQKATGMKLMIVREFQLGDSYERKIITFEKTSKPTVKLPRQEGQAQKNPLE